VTVYQTLTGVECTVAVLGLKPKRRTPSIGERIQAADEKVMAKMAKRAKG